MELESRSLLHLDDTQDANLARLIEQAARHQTRALSWLRQARDPTLGGLTPLRRRALLLRTLEHILAARRLLTRAQDGAESAEVLELLARHRQRLAATAESTERLLDEIDGAVGGAVND